MKLREDRKPSTSSSQANPSKSSRDPNIIDIDAIKKVDKLSKEQEKWLGKGLCFRCSKHKVKRGEKCRYPKYKGFYELPPSSSPSTYQFGARHTHMPHAVPVSLGDFGRN